MINLETLEGWLNAPVENERLEFKQAKNQFDTNKLLKYCVALANERGGHFILGVTDKRPRKIVGSQAFPTPEEINSNELPRRKRTGYQNQNILNCRFWCSCRYSLSCSFTYLAIIPSSPCFPTVLA